MGQGIRTGEIKNTQNISLGKPGRKRHIGKPRTR